MSLPTRIKVNIRDLWSKDDSDVQRSIAEVKKLIGHDVVIEPEWQLLWPELQKNYEEPSRFVPDIARATVAWCTSLCEVAEDDSNEEWTETLLEKLQSTHLLKVLLDVGDGKPTTHWSNKHKAFEIYFPKAKPINQTHMFSGYHAELLKAFEEPKPSTLTTRPPKSGAVVEDGFTEVDASDFDTASVLTPATGERYVPRAPAADALPSVNMLERPEDLMKRPPYHLILTHAQYGKYITIQGSHQPSLELISDYFKKWTKKNYNQTTRPPAAEITMKESCFGLGLLFDRLDFEHNAYDHKHGLGPPLIVAFIEGVLGYRITYQDASSWTFRREVAFKG